MINQVGRDAGKVVSNAVFKDKHSTPIRMIRNGNGTTFVKSEPALERTFVDDMEKMLDFQMAHQTRTLVNKINGAFIFFRKQVNRVMEDEFVTAEEYFDIIEISNQLNAKIHDMHELYLMNKEEGIIDALSTITKKKKELMTDFLLLAIDSFEDSIKTFEVSKIEMNSLKFGKWYLFSLIFCNGRLRNGFIGQTAWFNTIIMNLAMLFFFPIGHLGIGTIYSLYTWYNERKSRKHDASVYVRKQEIYKEMIDTCRSALNDCKEQ